MAAGPGEVSGLVIPGRLPGLNEMINDARRHAQVGGRHKKRWTTYCFAYAKRAGLPTFGEPVRIVFHWIEPNRRRDPDNIRAAAKFVLDALVLLKTIPNDSQKWIHELVDDFTEIDDQNPRVVVEIVPVARGFGAR